MIMKKDIVGIVGLSILMFISGCSTKYDNLEISKIESFWTEGFGPFYRKFTRTFDFNTNTVFDTIVVDQEEYNELLQSGRINEDDKHFYNNPVTITSFDEEQEKKFVKKVKSLGLYTWKDSYETKEIINDGGSKRITIYFTDGTSKSTYFYFKFPSNYNKVGNAFENYLGTGIFYELNWSAAYTEIGFDEATSVPPILETYNFKLNRPFMYSITYRDLPLFVGMYVK